MTILEMTFTGTVLILAVLLVRAAALNRLPKTTFLVLWGVVLLRLLVPVSLPSPWSAYTPFTGMQVPVSKVFSADEVPVTVEPEIFEAIPPEENISAGIDHGEAFAVPQPAISAAPVIPAVPAVPTAPSAPAAPSLPSWTAVHTAGSILLAIFFLVSYLWQLRRFRKAARRSADPADFDLPILRRKVTLRCGADIPAPLTYGVLHPVILLPQAALKDEEGLRYILAHEYVHIRRFDAVWKLLLAAAVCVHWFNPLVWVMFFVANRDLELSCDDRVLRAFGGDVRASYANTLIRMEESKSGLLPLASGFSHGAITQRIRAIMKNKKVTFGTVAAAVLVVAAVTVFLATSPMEVDAAGTESTDMAVEAGSGSDEQKDTPVDTALTGNVQQDFEQIWKALVTAPAQVYKDNYGAQIDAENSEIAAYWDWVRPCFTEEGYADFLRIANGIHRMAVETGCKIEPGELNFTETTGGYCTFRMDNLVITPDGMRTYGSENGAIKIAEDGRFAFRDTSFHLAYQTMTDLKKPMHRSGGFPNTIDSRIFTALASEPEEAKKALGLTEGMYENTYYVDRGKLAGIQWFGQDALTFYRPPRYPGDTILWASVIEDDPRYWMLKQYVFTFIGLYGKPAEVSVVPEAQKTLVPVRNDRVPYEGSADSWEIYLDGFEEVSELTYVFYPEGESALGLPRAHLTFRRLPFLPNQIEVSFTFFADPYSTGSTGASTSPSARRNIERFCQSMFSAPAQVYVDNYEVVVTEEGNEEMGWPPTKDLRASTENAEDAVAAYWEWVKPYFTESAYRDYLRQADTLHKIAVESELSFHLSSPVDFVSSEGNSQRLEFEVKMADSDGVIFNNTFHLDLWVQAEENGLIRFWQCDLSPIVKLTPSDLAYDYVWELDEYLNIRTIPGWNMNLKPGMTKQEVELKHRLHHIDTDPPTTFAVEGAWVVAGYQSIMVLDFDENDILNAIHIDVIPNGKDPDETFEALLAGLTELLGEGEDTTMEPYTNGDTPPPGLVEYTWRRNGVKLRLQSSTGNRRYSDILTVHLILQADK